MKAVILAAGQGTRIRSVHGEHPKCLIEVDNTTILDHQLDALSMVGINDVAIVIGYEKEQIINHVMSRKLSHIQRIHLIENPAFAITNNRTRRLQLLTISIRFGSHSNGSTVTVSLFLMLTSSLTLKSLTSPYGHMRRSR